jgi:hypothetical protein
VGNVLFGILLGSVAILLQTRARSEKKGHQNVTHTLEADVISDLPFYAFRRISWILLTDHS